ncbi:MAG TPA: M36 family metallopeptidase [Thermoanaerobaculia bacterium]|jgi:hypothetical protein|nr:M36 family metallopeptidase [Thermoanaerobaculia bacterium]
MCTRKRNLILVGWSLIGSVALSSIPAAAQIAIPREEKAFYGNYDIRFNGREALARLTEGPLAADLGEMARAAAAAKPAMDSGLAELRAGAPDALVETSPLTGSAEVVRVPGGSLTAAAGGPARDLALSFLRRHAAVYGLSPEQMGELQVRGESVSRESGLRMVRLRQTVHGLPVFQSEMRAILDRDGRLVRTVGRLVPGVDDRSVPALSLAGQLAPEDALAAGLATVGSPAVTRAGKSELVYFPLAPGVLVPAWSQVAFVAGPADWYLVVDAATGTLLYRKNIEHQVSTQNARFSVYLQADNKTPADSPAPRSPNLVAPHAGTQFAAIPRRTAAMLTVQDPIASPDGWIPDGGTTTSGNNVDTYLDRDGDDFDDIGSLDVNGRPTGNFDGAGRTRDFLGAGFSYTPAPVGANPNAGDDPSGSNDFKRGSVTQLFYVTNFYHDRLYALGFDEGAGNFQSNNFGRGGAAGDRVLAEAQQGVEAEDPRFNNANFSTPPDGENGIMRMFLFDGPSPDRDGSLDAEIVLHELTHGLSNRLIGDGAGLNWFPGGSMGEGWSDFYALSLLNNTPADKHKSRYGYGAYATYQLAGLPFTDNYVSGIRRFPYSTDSTVNPLTWADADDTTANMSGGLPPSPLGFEFNGALEPHNAGEIWALSLWEARSRVILAHGNNVPAGNNVMLQIVTDALKLTPIDPSFVQARDALIDADCATHACANEASIWGGFADRGLGFGATTSQGIATHIGVKESFELPNLNVTSVQILDSGNNHFPDPGETVRLKLTLKNPWHSTAKGATGITAMLTSATPGVTVTQKNSAYPAIPAQGSAANSTLFIIKLPVGFACGRSILLDLATASSLGGRTQRIVLRAGKPAGIGPVRTFTKSIPGGVAIPDGFGSGVTSALPVTMDLEIADLDFKLNSLTHTWVGDLTVEVRSPSGFGTDMIFQPAGCVPDGCFFGLNSGDNFTNTTFDDAATNDLVLIGGAAAPFTGQWLPFFNSPSLGDVGVTQGELSHFNGQGTLGNWQVFVSDNASRDVGRLNSWSLLIRPRLFTCM